MKEVTAFAQAISFPPAVVLTFIAAGCGTSSPSQGGPLATLSFAIGGGDFSGNSVAICGSRTPPADAKYFCSNVVGTPDGGAALPGTVLPNPSTWPWPTGCPCFNFAADGTPTGLDGGPAELTDLCASDDLSTGADAGTVADWTFTYTIFNSVNCTGIILNPNLTGGFNVLSSNPDNFTCYDLKNLATQANPNASVEVLNPGPNTTHIICGTQNASAPFDFTSCSESCIDPIGALPGSGCATIQLECGCTPNDAGTACGCGPDGGLAQPAAPANCSFDPTTCDILCTTCPPGLGGSSSGERQVLCGQTCTDLQVDPNNCNACGNVCPFNNVCLSGAPAGVRSSGNCVPCASGLTACGTTISIQGFNQNQTTSVCVDAQTDNNNCGTCGNVCPANATCQSGSCNCPLTACSSQSCTDLQTDPNNCGTCGNVCPPNNACESGSCVDCGSLTACGQTCEDTLSDFNNCGGCGNSCASPEEQPSTVCIDGFCD
jgi:hypothetical protein